MLLLHRPLRIKEIRERWFSVDGTPADCSYLAVNHILKGRRPDKPAAVMFFNVDLALAAVPELGERTRAALEALLPGGVTVLVPNPAGRFPLCITD